MFEGYNFNQAPENYSDDDLIRAYLLERNDKNPRRHVWAIYELDDIVRDDPERAWPIILFLSEKFTNPEFVGTLAAGPMEDLLSQHGLKFIERIEQRAKANSKFNYLLGGVWKSNIPKDVWNRLQAARKQTW